VKIAIFIVILYISMVSSCKNNIPEIIDENIVIYHTSGNGFITWENKNNKKDDIIYDCIILNNDNDYHEIIKNYVKGISFSKIKKKNKYLYLEKNLFKLLDKYKSIEQIQSTETDYIEIDDLYINSGYFILIMECNISKNKIRRYNIFSIRTGNDI